MKRGVTGACIATMLSIGAVAFAQTTGQGQPPTAPTGQTQPGTRMGGDQETGQQVTVTGCIQREADYRRAHEQGRGGAMGTGVGAGNEFVLANASIGAGGSHAEMGGMPSGTTASGTTAGTASGTASGTTAGTASGTAGTASGTAGTTGSASGTAGSAFRLTGSRESELEKYVGQRVEIVGKIEGGAPQGTSGTAGASFSDLREIDIASFRSVPGTCPVR